MVSVPSLRGLVSRLPLTRRPLPSALAALVGGLFLLAFLAAPALADSPFSWSPPVNVDGISPIDSVSCPSTSLCVAGASAGFVVTSTNPTGGESAWTYPAFVDDPLEDEGRALHDLSCVSSPSLLCTAVDQTGHVVTSTEPTGGAATWHVVSMAGSGVVPWGILRLVAVRDRGQRRTRRRVFSSTDPTGSGSAWNPVSLKDHGEPVGQIYGVSCPSSSLCVAAGSATPAAQSTALPARRAGAPRRGPPPTSPKVFPTRSPAPPPRCASRPTDAAKSSRRPNRPRAPRLGSSPTLTAKTN